MSDDLLSYYNRELAYLRKLGGEFAEQHPGAAGRLRMTRDAVEDPHVSRLLEGVAFLNARIRAKLDDEFPELTEGLIEQLYPHYMSPIPSMAIVQLGAATDLAETKVIAAGTEILTEPVMGERCRFRTTAPAQVIAARIDRATLAPRPIVAPVTPPGAMSVLRLSLACVSKDTVWSQLAPPSLRFFLRGAAADTNRLYELIFNNTVAVAIADSVDDKAPLVLGPDAIEPVGFGRDEGLLPYSARSPIGYRLLTEYFAFPEKFQFFDVAGVAEKARKCEGGKLEIFLFFDRSAPELERSVSPQSFALGCTPVVNLFRQRAEPIPLTGQVTEYRVTPDQRRPGTMEIYSIDKVAATSQAGEAMTFAPLYGFAHAAAARGETRFWHMARRPVAADEAAREVFLTFVDREGDPSAPQDWVASIETTCTNRELASKLPFGGGRPTLALARSQPAVVTLACLTPPTQPARRWGRREAAWRLISHLVLNHLSLTDLEGGAEALREILRLYDVRDAAETRAMIDAVGNVRARRSSARAPSWDMGVVCRGVDVAIEFDESRTSGSGVFLLAAVLERFLGHYVSINTFSRLTATIKGKSGVLRTWPPRAGDLALL